MRVTWEPIPPQYWNGDTQTGGYKVLYQPVSDIPIALQTIPSQLIMGTTEKTLIIGDLVRDRNYDIIVVPFNSQGNGPPSMPIPVYVGEAVPTGEPRSVSAFAISSTEVRLSWEHPQQNQQNGDLLGYKVVIRLKHKIYETILSVYFFLIDILHCDRFTK